MKNERVINIIIATIRKALLLDVEIDNEKLILEVMAEAMCSRRTAREYIDTARIKLQHILTER